MSAQNEKRGMSTGAKIGLGCGIGCFVVILVLVIAVFTFSFIVRKKGEQYLEELRRVGFEKEVVVPLGGPPLEVRADITQSTLYGAQIVKIMGNSTTNIGIVAQMAELHGTIEGKVYFRGQMLTVQPTAALRNGLDIKALVFLNQGKIEGEITGNYPGMPPPQKPAE
ncbi:MAG: hypothetical protein JXR37_11320 [Kiritimatiellae bacterium]|nr:hypothetical protein [Kiritimatiellia bacterium]